MLTIAFRTDNDAFEPTANAEAARILRQIADRLGAGHDDGQCVDSNGNRVGAWSLADHRASD